MGLLSNLTATLSSLLSSRPANRAASFQRRSPVQRLEALTRLRTTPARPIRSREKVPASGNASAIGKVWFLPYADTATGETPAIRAAYRQMPSNEMVKAGLMTKILAVAALDWQVQPAKEGSPRDQEAADFCRHNIERCPGGMSAIITGMLWPHLVDGFAIGEKIIEVEETDHKWRDKIVLKNIKPKDTNHLRIQGDRFNNVNTIESLLDSERVAYPITDFVYIRNMPVFDNPLGTSDLRPAYKHFWMADTVTKLRAIHAEKYTSPFLLGEYEDDDQQTALEESLAAARAGTWMSVPAGVKVQAMALANAGESDYKSFLDDCARNILIGIIGAYLQTLEGQVSDARGDTQVSKSIVELFQWMLAVVVQEMFNRQVFPDLIDWNYSGCGYPRLTLGGVSEQELQSMIQTFQGAQSLGLELPRKNTYSRLGIQPPSSPDDKLTPPGAAPAASPFGAAPAGPGGGFPGALPFSERPSPAEMVQRLREARDRDLPAEQVQALARDLVRFSDSERRAMADQIGLRGGAA